MNSMTEEQDFEIISLVEKLNHTPERSSHAVTIGRAVFLADAQMYPLPVSKTPERRHIEWKTFFSRKANPKMATISTLILIFTLLFGGTGATVLAAQNSLPDQALYPVKLMTEDIRTGLSPQSDDQLELALQFAQKRLDEMLAMNQAGHHPATNAGDRWEYQVQFALRLTANMDETEFTQSLSRVHELLMGQENLINQHFETAPADPTLERVREQLRDHLGIVVEGLVDHDAFRSRVHNNDFGHQPEQGPGDTHEPEGGPDPMQTPFSHTQEPGHPSSDVPHSGATLQPTYHSFEEQHQSTMVPQYTSQPKQHQNNPEPTTHPSEPNHNNNDSGGDHGGGDGDGYQGGHD